LTSTSKSIFVKSFDLKEEEYNRFCCLANAQLICFFGRYDSLKYRYLSVTSKGSILMCDCRFSVIDSNASNLQSPTTNHVFFSPTRHQKLVGQYKLGLILHKVLQQVPQPAFQPFSLLPQAYQYRQAYQHIRFYRYRLDLDK